MAVTPFQRTLCRLLAADRRSRGDSDVAGGVALGMALDAQRVSRDLDLFHDTTQRLQPFGYLAWAACGKDPDTARYSAAEVATLAFEGDAPDAALLSRQWQEALATASEIVRALPAEHIGSAVLTESGELARIQVSEIQAALARGALRFHPGRIGGAWPTVVPGSPS